MISKIMLATVGERKPTWRERIAAFFRPVLQPRVAYPIAMTVFTFSIIVNAAGLNLRSLRFEDLNPRTWVDRANRQGHLMYARAEKFYYDLRVVYEIESRFRQLRRPAADPGGRNSQTCGARQAVPRRARRLTKRWPPTEARGSWWLPRANRLSQRSGTRPASPGREGA